MSLSNIVFYFEYLKETSRLMHYKVVFHSVVSELFLSLPSSWAYIGGEKKRREFSRSPSEHWTDNNAIYCRAEI